MLGEVSKSLRVVFVSELQPDVEEEELGNKLNKESRVMNKLLTYKYDRPDESERP